MKSLRHGCLRRESRCSVIGVVRYWFTANTHQPSPTGLFHHHSSSDRLIKQLRIPFTVLSLHRIQLPLVQHETLRHPLEQWPPLPLLKLQHLSLIFTHPVSNKDLAQTDAPDISSWAPHEPALDNILPTRTPLTYPIPSPEPHCSILLAKTSPDSSTWLASAHELGAITQDEGIPNAGPLPSSVIRAIQEDTMTMDAPPQFPPTPSATGIAIVGPSRQEPGIGHAGNRPPHPSHGQYGIV
jgi:hypothetical protein